MVLNRVKLIHCLKDGSKTSHQIAELLNISSDTVKNYMQSYVDIGFVDFKLGKYNLTKTGAEFIKTVPVEIIPAQKVVQTKKCIRCGIDQDVSNFHKDPQNKDGLYSWCKTCKSERDRDLSNKRNADKFQMETNKKLQSIIDLQHKQLELLKPSGDPGDPSTLFDHICMVDDNSYNVNEGIKTLIELTLIDNGHFKRCFAELIAIQKKQLLLFEQLSKKQQND